VPLRLMSYRRSFRYLRTHVLSEAALSGELERDRELVFGALREGRCYMAVDSLAPARGFSFGAGEGTAMGAEAPFDGQTLTATTPRAAQLRVIRDGRELTRRENVSQLEHQASEPGVYRVEAHLGDRTWILSNPVYLR
jgi:hypothetical protein